MSSQNSKELRRAANVFINYRREDSAGHAGRLFDRMGNHFPGRVFMDIDTIEPGVDFMEVIERAVGYCEVLIVVIGREWLNIKDASGRRRLDSPKDFVRLEVAAALERNIRVIPVLVEGASMPSPEDLPPDLARLARRNAIELSDARWAFDADRLIQTIERVLQEQRPAAPAKSVPPSMLISPAVPAGRSVRPNARMAFGVVLVLTLAAWTGWSFAKPPVRQGESKAAATPVTVEPEPSPAMPETQPRPEDHVGVTQATSEDNRQAETRVDNANAKEGRMRSVMRRTKQLTALIRGK